MKKLSMLAACCASFLTACGGGGANDTQPETVPHPEGRYDGSSPSTGRGGVALVLGARSYWLFYSAPGNAALLGGLVQGDITASSVAGFQSANVRDFNYEGLGTSFGTASASVVRKASIDATVIYSGGTAANFVGAYNATFEQTPSLATIAGTYTGTAATVATGRQASTGTISADGHFSGSSGGCISTGTVAPRPAADDSGSASPRYGGNAYDFTVTFGGAPCYYAGQTFTGVALYDADTKSILAAAPNAARTDAAAFAGTKP